MPDAHSELRISESCGSEFTDLMGPQVRDSRRIYRQPYAGPHLKRLQLQFCRISWSPFFGAPRATFALTQNRSLVTLQLHGENCGSNCPQVMGLLGISYRRPSFGLRSQPGNSYTLYPQ